MNFVPTRVYIDGAAYNGRKENKNSRDRASHLIGLSRVNIVSLTSIYPARARIISREEFLASVQEGEVVYAVNGVCESNTPGTIVTAGMGIVIPDDINDPDRPRVGYFTELYEETGVDSGSLQERIEKSAIQLMADQITGDFPPEEVKRMWEFGRRDYTADGVGFKVYPKIYSTRVNYEGDYAVALVAAVLLP